ncbi:MAG: hypothetical protein EXR68_05990 [Dehalococcoidia bacterium]|nr:hypothetical protein [Dehalococcoidia bacterium]
MKFTTAVLINIAAVGGYLAARTLLENDTDLDRLPTAARNPLEAGRVRVQRARVRARAALAAGCLERDATERELMARYHTRTRL